MAAERDWEVGRQGALSRENSLGKGLNWADDSGAGCVQIEERRWPTQKRWLKLPAVLAPLQAGELSEKSPVPGTVTTLPSFLQMTLKLIPAASNPTIRTASRRLPFPHEGICVGKMECSSV